MSALTGIADTILAVTPSDSTDLPGGAPTGGLLVGTAGNASIIDASGETKTIPLFAGFNPVGPRRIRSTGTTASNIWALYL